MPSVSALPSQSASLPSTNSASSVSQAPAGAISNVAATEASAGVYHNTIVYTPPGVKTFAGMLTPIGFTPQQIQKAYGIDQLYGIIGNGAGQTVAIVDAFDDPGFVNSTDPSFASSDLHQFDVQFGLPDPPSFIKLDQNGGNSLPATDASGAAEVEEALDVEWVHSVAPGANIILFEANGLNLGDLFTAIATAANTSGVSAVSMSFGSGEFNGEQTLDSTFTTPAGHQGVTFIASAGDSGAPGAYPAYSPNVLAIGGTALTLNPDNSYKSETTWNDGNGNATGGGTSVFEPEPAYQKQVQNTGQRTIPDVAFDADPNTGVAVYDSFTFGAATPWNEIGGTSLSAPAWAGLISIANQGLAQRGRPSLDGPTQTIPELYALFQTNPGDFHDITTGNNNGFSAGPGYDETTGLGTPLANLLIPDLIGLNVQTTLTSAVEGQPLTSVPVATFQDTSTKGAGSFQVTIFWGDNSSSAGTVISNGSGNFTVLGTHTYAEEGRFTLTVSVTDRVKNKSGFGSGPVTVTDAPLTGTPAPPLSSATGQFLSNVLTASFTDTDVTPEGPGNFTATSIWFQGNGQSATSTDTLVSLGNNTFFVFGSNPFSYAGGGTFIVRTIIRDIGGATVTVDTTVNVTGVPAIGGPGSPLIPEETGDTSTVNPQFVVMEDALTNLLDAENVFFASFLSSPVVQMSAMSNLFFADMTYLVSAFAFELTLPF